MRPVIFRKMADVSKKIGYFGIFRRIFYHKGSQGSIFELMRMDQWDGSIDENIPLAIVFQMYHFLFYHVDSFLFSSDLVFGLADFVPSSPVFLSPILFYQGDMDDLLCRENQCLHFHLHCSNHDPKLRWWSKDLWQDVCMVQNVRIVWPVQTFV